MGLNELIKNMESCEQAPGHSTLDHGISVLVNMHELVNGTPRGPVPKWYVENHESITAAMPDISVWGTYAVYHDCGKWKVREVDGEGRQHFPDHARVSADLWRNIEGLGRGRITRPAVATLMKYDMLLHTATASELAALLVEPPLTSFWSTLLISSLAELHANAPMFGGFESESFKIKAKQVKRRGAQVCRRLF